MKRRPAHFLALLLASAVFQSQAPARQQQPAPAETPPPAATTQTTPTRPAPQVDDADDDDVVRITTNLVQFDAVVTDKKGRQVTDLRPEELEVTVDGKPQALTHFSYVSNVSSAPTPSTPSADAPAPVPGVPPVPAARLRPEQVRRTIAFVFNDLQMSWESVYYARRAIKKFVDEQMEPGDFVAIIPTSGGSGALQQFTSDKRLLGAAVKNLRWQPQWNRTTVFERIEETFDKTDAERQYEVRRRERFSVGTLNALDAVVGALSELPGRKSLVMLSDGIPVPPPDEDAGRVLAGINRVVESANRASVIIYTVDARGLQNLGIFDAGQSVVLDPESLMRLSQVRSADLHDSQRGMKTLAEETGGVAYVNTNDIGGGVRRAIEDQRGYYLIGFRPGEGTFDAATGRLKFHKVSVKVRRAGLKVRTRAGFFGFEGKSLTPTSRPRTRAQQIRAALVAPFPAGGVRLRLTPLFGRDVKQGAFVRSLLHVEGGDVSFTRQPDGTYKAVLDVVALTFGVNGRPVGEANMTHTVLVKAEDYEKTLRGGLVYNMIVPAKKAGGYQLRVAVRDTATERVGSASQFVEVPDLKKDRLALSGLVLSSRVAGAAPASGDATATDAGAPDPLGGAAVRRFRRGAAVDYGFHIYNAKVEAAGGAARMQTQVRLFRDGRAVFTGQVLPFDGRPQNVAGDISAGGQLRLGNELGPGEYVLQLIVTDRLAKEKYRVAAQWIDFEIVE
ncbi:MAG TPA: VWA domain-containing protein [Pyrinomonadaceae bacterium]|jgi:VWFA-related protein